MTHTACQDNLVVDLTHLHVHRLREREFFIDNLLVQIHHII